MKFAIITTDSHVDYSFVSPISALIWREVIGIEPIVCLVGDEAEWNSKPKQRISMNHLDSWNLRRKFISRVDGYRSSTVAQVSRMFAAAEPFSEDTILVTTDADMWPLSKPWFDQIQHDRLTLFYGNAYNADRFPMCYIAARVDIWREILGIGVSSMSKAIAGHLMNNLASTADEGTAWHHDEIFLGQRIKAWSGYASRSTIVSRYGDPPGDRIDRACWPGTASIQGAVDAHLCRPTYDQNFWQNRHRPMLAQLLKQEWVKAVDQYVLAHALA